MNQTKIDDIYFNTKLKKRVVISSNKINKNLDETLKEILVNELEGKCVKEGYVKEDSIEIIERSSPYLYGNQFNGNIAIDIIYRAKIWCPMRNSIIECSIEKINKLGILAINGPLYIIIARQFHKDKSYFKDLDETKRVLAKVIDKRFNINEKKISVIAELYVKGGSNKKLEDNESNDEESDEGSDEGSDDEESNDEESDEESGNEESDEGSINESDNESDKESINEGSEDGDSNYEEINDVESNDEESDYEGGDDEDNNNISDTDIEEYEKNKYDESDNEVKILKNDYESDENGSINSIEE